MLGDDDLMPFGKHSGKQMEDVPDAYLLWLYDQLKEKNHNSGSDNYRVLEYIKDNLDVLDGGLPYPKKWESDLNG